MIKKSIDRLAEELSQLPDRTYHICIDNSLINIFKEPRGLRVMTYQKQGGSQHSIKEQLFSLMLRNVETDRCGNIISEWYEIRGYLDNKPMLIVYSYGVWITKNRINNL